MNNLIHLLERRVLISATVETVFRYFADSNRFAAWFGTGSRIEGKIGGEVLICYPGGVTASGRVVEWVENQRVVFTYGYDQPGKPIAPGGSRVTITLQPGPEGTLVQLAHAFADVATREQHVQGWRHQLGVFAAVVASEQYQDLAQQIDAFFAAWNQTDLAARKALLAEVISADFTFRDRYSATEGLEDLAVHLGAFQVFMPGMTIAREGAPKQCQGTAIVGWASRGADGAIFGRGTNVVRLSPQGRMTSIVGFWE